MSRIAAELHRVRTLYQNHLTLGRLILTTLITFRLVVRIVHPTSLPRNTLINSFAISAPSRLCVDKHMINAR